MSVLNEFILRIKRGDTPAYARMKRLSKAALRFRVPLPLPWIWLITVIHGSSVFLSLAWMRICVMFYREPLFRRQCVAVGKNLHLELLPSIGGHVRIRVGDNVMISGALSISCSRVIEEPQLTIGNDVFIGHQVVLHPNKQIVIEDGVLIASDCFITDSNEHPIDMERRLRGEPCQPEEIRPVFIRRGAWLGKASIVLRGVEIGEGAIVGAGSIVTSSVAPFTIVAGNPAKFVREVVPPPLRNS